MWEGAYCVNYFLRMTGFSWLSLCTLVCRNVIPSVAITERNSEKKYFCSSLLLSKLYIEQLELERVTSPNSSKPLLLGEKFFSLIVVN